MALTIRVLGQLKIGATQAVAATAAMLYQKIQTAHATSQQQGIGSNSSEHPRFEVGRPN